MDRRLDLQRPDYEGVPDAPEVVREDEKADEHLNDTDDAPKSVTISLAEDSASLAVSGHVPAEGTDGATAMVELVETPPELPGGRCVTV